LLCLTLTDVLNGFLPQVCCDSVVDVLLKLLEMVLWLSLESNRKHLSNPKLTVYFYFSFQVCCDSVVDVLITKFEGIAYV
jgi:hypothetical protein